MSRHPRHRNHKAPNAPRWTQERSPYASQRLEQLRARYGIKPGEKKEPGSAPVIDQRPKLRESLEEWLDEFTQQDGGISPSALIPVLQKSQDMVGYLPEWVMADIADRLRLPYSTVYGVATFYAQFRLVPQGRNTIKVCMGTACHVRGGASILEALRDELGIGPGETTPDLEFTMERVACLGACGLAPVVVVNDEAHGRMTPAKVKELVAQVRKEAANGAAD